MRWAGGGNPMPRPDNPTAELLRELEEAERHLRFGRVGQTRRAVRRAKAVAERLHREKDPLGGPSEGGTAGL